MSIKVFGGIPLDNPLHRNLTDEMIIKWNNKVDSSDINNVVLDIIGSPSELKKALEDLAAALLTDSNLSVSIMNQIGSKADNVLASSITNGLLSKEDKIKLDSIVTNNYSSIRIGSNTLAANKSGDLLIIEQGRGITLTSDIITNKITISTEFNTGLASPLENGLMSSSDKDKLNNISMNANFYQHPTTHPAAVIVQDTGNRFVTDSEKAAWNKAAYTLATETNDGLMNKNDKKKLNSIIVTNGDVAFDFDHLATKTELHTEVILLNNLISSINNSLKDDILITNNSIAELDTKTTYQLQNAVNDLNIKIESLQNRITTLELR